MTVIKRTILFYLVGLVLLFLVPLFFGVQVRLILSNRAIWILPAIFSVLGLLIGIGLSALLRKSFSKNSKIFLAAHSLMLILMAILAIVSENEEQYQKKHANVEANHNVMKYFVNDNEDYIRIGFNRLESEFKNPNDFNLDAFSVRKRDTIINGIQDTVYNIYFAYFLNGDKTTKYFSKVSVLDRIPSLSLYNLNTESSDEYSVIKSEKAESEREAAKSIKEAFRQMPDSTKQMIKKAFAE